MGDISYKRSHREQGLCVYCSEYALPYHSRCEKHIRSHRSTQFGINHRNQVERLEKGLCPRCGGERTDNRKYCVNCREQTGRRNRI